MLARVALSFDGAEDFDPTLVHASTLPVKDAAVRYMANHRFYYLPV